MFQVTGEAPPSTSAFSIPIRAESFLVYALFLETVSGCRDPPDSVLGWAVHSLCGQEPHDRWARDTGAHLLLLRDLDSSSSPTTRGSPLTQSLLAPQPCTLTPASAELWSWVLQEETR